MSESLLIKFFDAMGLLLNMNIMLQSREFNVPVLIHHHGYSACCDHYTILAKCSEYTYTANVTEPPNVE